MLRFITSRLTWELSKSFSAFASVLPPVALHGNGTLPVSWFTKTSARLLPRLRSEMPSGIASNR